ncbi:diguanylate cyclase [Oxalobacteraceae bacterium R-40]|uniref:Diguanylate cyclase n=1 Tax=Keguizhuia sedimenti TaxID=3064264 RepID=A0ABU1BV03_9BURK|nr:diguanylate cyclase [Oxalobacteraceae bacterium R-40]
MNKTIQTVQKNSPYLQLGLIVGLLITILWTAIYLDLQRSRAELYSKSERDLSNLALAFGKEIESSVKTIDLSLLDLRQYWRGNPGDFGAAVRNRQAYLKKELAFQVAIIGPDGILLFSSLEQPSTPIDLSDREHFRVHQVRSTDELYISKPVLGRLSKQWSIQFTRPIYDKDDRFAGVIVLSVSPEYFYRFYRSINLPADAAISVLRDSGEILARYPDPGVALGKSMSNAPFMGPMAREEGTFRRISQFDGIERLYAWRKIGEYELDVVIGYSIKGIFAPYGEQRSRYIAVGILLSLLLLLVGYLKLITTRQQQNAARKLAENEERWRVALEAAGDGVWDWNVAQERVIFSNGWKTMLGFLPEEIGTGLDEWKKRVHPDDMAKTMQDVMEHFSGKTKFYANEHRVRCKDGGWKWILDRGMVIQRDKDGNPLRMVGTHTDISSRKEMEQTLNKLATTDALTELSNRRHFLERLNNELARIKRYPGTHASVLMADLDYFKKINDTYGHAVGDAALKHFSTLLRGTARQSDFLGRLGGEEFGVLLTGTDVSEAKKFSDHLCTALRESPLKVGELSIPITVSIGLTRLKFTDTDVEQALHRADMALYEAKRLGRDRAVTNCE